MHVLGSFIFGLPTDKPDTFDATVELAEKAGVTFAQFVMLTPLPGTIDFERWEKGSSPAPNDGRQCADHALLAHPRPMRPKMFIPHPSMSSDEIRERTQGVWDRFYSWRAIWKRSTALQISAPAWPLCSSPSSTARCTPKPASPPTARAERNRKNGLAGRPVNAESSSMQNLCPELQSPLWERDSATASPRPAFLNSNRPDKPGPLAILR